MTPNKDEIETARGIVDDCFAAWDGAESAEEMDAASDREQEIIAAQDRTRPFVDDVCKAIEDDEDADLSKAFALVESAEDAAD